MIYPDNKPRQTTVIIKRKQLRRRIRRYKESHIQREAPLVSDRQRRKRKRQPILHRDENGNFKQLNPKDTYWYRLYINSPHLSNPKFHHKFRRRFRLPYDSFTELLEKVSSNDRFIRWKPTMRRPFPRLGLLLLGSLRYLGRGWTFDDLEESTAISEDVYRDFFTYLLNMVAKCCILNMSSTPRIKMKFKHTWRNLKWLVYMVPLHLWMLATFLRRNALIG